MSKPPKILRPFIGRPESRAIPDRIQEVVDQFEDQGERLIGWVQLGIGLFLSVLYFVSRRPEDAFMGYIRQPVPLSLSIYLTFTIVRLMLSYRFRLPKWFVFLSVLVDITTLYGVIWYFHVQYGQSAGFYLKAPTVMYVFFFIAIRALRFEPAWVLITGAVAAIGWVGMTIYAIEKSGTVSVTRSFVAYIESDQILIGAEVDKVVAILGLSLALALALTRAKRLLAVAVREKIEREEIRRFLPEDIENAITKAPASVIAGDAVERDAAVIVLDIRGFTHFLNENEPGYVVSVLVDLHARIVPIIQRHGGIVDKYLGDGLLATFGASRPSKTAAADALAALTQIMPVAEVWSAEMSEIKGAPPLKVNGAVTAGRLVFTALGDAQRLEYTVIGDAVNLAAKLEKHNKIEGSAALTTFATFKLASGQGFIPDRRFTEVSDRHVQGVDAPLDLMVVWA